jgi:multiple sugar transport system substrate-binding protein
MRRTVLWLLVVIITIGMLTTLSFTGCKTATTEGTTAAVEETTAAAEETAAAETTAAGEKPFAGVKLNVVNMLGWAVTKPVLENHLAEFEEATGIDVVLNEMPFADIRTKETLEGENKTGAYDVLQMYDSAMPILTKYCMPLDDYIASSFGSVDAWKSARYGSAVFQVSFDGKIMVEPLMGGDQIGFYRKDLFEDPANMEAFKAEYGYDLAPPTTKQQLVDIAKFFTKGDMYGLAIPGKSDHGFCIFEMQMFDSGFQFTDENYKLAWPDHKDELIKIAKFDQDLVQTLKVTPAGCVSWEMPEMVEEYFAGKAAMCVSWLHDFWGTAQLDETKAKIGETGTFVFPSDTDMKGGYIGYWGWGISKDSKNPDAAWEFVKWFNSEEMQKAMLSDKGAASFLSAQTAVSEWGVENGYIAPATAEAATTAQQFIFFDQLDLLRAANRPAHEELLGGTITPEQFVDSGIKAMTDILNEAGIAQ